MRDNYDVYESREALQRPQGCASGLARTASKHLDDIGVWSDLVFQTVSKKFLPPIEQNNGPQGVDGSSTAGYRDYHEVAWVINRFARVARCASRGSMACSKCVTPASRGSICFPTSKSLGHSSSCVNKRIVKLDVLLRASESRDFHP